VVRLFVAIDLPQDLKKELYLIPDKVAKLIKNVKWVSPENVHLTLKFLGSSPEESVPKIKEKLSKKVKEVEPFTLGFGTLGAFPTSKRARVFWLGVEKGADEVSILQKKVEKALVPLGFEKENRKFHAHLTLARLRMPQNLQSVISELEAEKISQEVSVDRVFLFQSTLTPKGPIYTTLAQFPLKGD